MHCQNLTYPITRDRLLALEIEADELVDSCSLNVLLELLDGALTAESMLTLELYCTELPNRYGLANGHYLIRIAYLTEWGLFVNIWLLFSYV